ncbi:MAG: hypothetical protein LKF79_01550 [Solobacterium sp.]|jgi:DNA-directed RNA polymerase subunit RPC12/RpoP|nr:hypothetical protein [Solobacterium sp.]MCH4222535.1 hypothetical protein [Solobacterium sp.]MCH4265312.1 hypothetical protein [Solobacterium sp.]
MKITCPACQKELYTNPFSVSNEIDCPFCHKRLIRSKQTEQLMRAFISLDVVGDAIVCGFVSSFYNTTYAAMTFFVFMLTGYLFELPQRSLKARGLLIYEVKGQKEQDPS